MKPVIIKTTKRDKQKIKQQQLTLRYKTQYLLTKKLHNDKIKIVSKNTSAE